MSKTATIVGSAAFVILIVGFFWFCKSQSKNLSNRNSETVEWNREAGQSSSYGESLFALHCPQQFTMEELEQATRKFNGSNLIGYGSFSQVYKGLLCYTIVAIKRQPGAQVQPQNLFLRSMRLCQLHSLKPPLVHRNFQTANVLVDENFIAKVVDAGVLRILEKIEDEDPSCTTTVDVLQDLE
ncbi:hypothetical protein SLE2022_166350 [Rubroshorea leprosula]